MAEERSDVVAGLINTTQARSYGHLGIDTSTATSTSVTRSVTFDKGATVAAAIDQLTAARQPDGLEWRIDADRKLRTGLVLGTDRRGELVFTENNTVGLDTDEGGEDLAAVARVDGDEVTGTAAAADAALETFGILDLRIDAPKVGTTGGASSLAADMLGRTAETGETFRITHVVDVNNAAGRRAFDYPAGDAATIYAETSQGLLSCDIRIASRSVRPARGSDTMLLVDIEAERVGSDGVLRALGRRHLPSLFRDVFDMRRRTA